MNARRVFGRFEGALLWPPGMFWRAGLRGGRLWLQYSCEFLNLRSSRDRAVLAAICVVFLYSFAGIVSGHGVLRQCCIAALAMLLWHRDSESTGNIFADDRTSIDSAKILYEEGVCYE